jgi:alpha-amylase/alpha-mannosidase (GH57 family)
LSEAQRTFVLRYFFQANVARMIYRYPRYGQLYEARESLARHATIQDLRDLQVLNQLVWFDEDQLRRDGELAELARKGTDYSLADQRLLTLKQREALASVLPVYSHFAGTGQIEISTTPFYHPILPLLCDSDIAQVSHPGVTLPTRFQYPGDAKEQLTLARSYMKEKLRVEPVGLWPSEGSVSDQALAIAADAGFRWAASDNGVLSQTLGEIAGCEQTYRPYLWQQDGREMHMLFRDRYLSDLVGFEYSRMSSADAAGHFLQKIRENAQDRDCVVPIILDGENAWEWYESQGRPFLRELYRRIEEDPQMEALTVSEALARYPAKTITRIHPGSWINANFDIWIGAGEDNRAWELLLEARKAYDEHSANAPGRDLAHEELLIAEGSDWCWWYGPEHGSDNRPEFDQLYRDHLANVYRALALPVPEALSHPILEAQSGEIRERPSNPLDVTLDGEVTSSFEWMGAGRYRPDSRSGAMHGGEIAAREVHYGTKTGRLYVRIDGAAESAKFGVEFESGAAVARSIRGKVVEMEAQIGGPRFRVTVEREGLAPVFLPGDGSWLEIE